MVSRKADLEKRDHFALFFMVDLVMVILRGDEGGEVVLDSVVWWIPKKKLAVWEMCGLWRLHTLHGVD